MYLINLELFEQIKKGYLEADISSCPDLAPVLFALCAYCEGGYITGTRRLKIKESDRASAMAEELSKLGFTTKPSKANFICFFFNDTATAEIYTELKKRNILVRHWNKEGISKHLRITIGTMEEMQALIAAIDLILEEG